MDRKHNKTDRRYRAHLARDGARHHPASIAARTLARVATFRRAGMLGDARQVLRNLRGPQPL